jgi:hypothetical protein
MNDMNMPIKELWFPFNDRNNQGPVAINELGFSSELPEVRIAFNYNYS